MRRPVTRCLLTRHRHKVYITAVAAPKRPRGRPRKHPVAQVFTPAPPSSSPVTHTAPSGVAETRRHQLTDVEADSSDSDVIITGYTAPPHVTASSRDPTRRAPARGGHWANYGATEIAGQENAGLENDGQSGRGGKCRTGN